MKYLIMLAFVACVSLLTGCTRMACPMYKKAEASANIGRYQIGCTSTQVFKVDTSTGEIWILTKKDAGVHEWTLLTK